MHRRTVNTYIRRLSAALESHLIACVCCTSGSDLKAECDECFLYLSNGYFHQDNSRSSQSAHYTYYIPFEFCTPRILAASTTLQAFPISNYQPRLRLRQQAFYIYLLFTAATMRRSDSPNGMFDMKQRSQRRWSNHWGEPDFEETRVSRRRPWQRFYESFKRDPRLAMTPRGVVGANGRVFDPLDAATATASSPLARQLKGRHLQMIAIGGSIGKGLLRF